MARCDWQMKMPLSQARAWPELVASRACSLTIPARIMHEVRLQSVTLFLLVLWRWCTGLEAVQRERDDRLSRSINLRGFRGHFANFCWFPPNLALDERRALNAIVLPLGHLLTTASSSEPWARPVRQSPASRVRERDAFKCFTRIFAARACSIGGLPTPARTAL